MESGNYLTVMIYETKDECNVGITEQNNTTNIAEKNQIDLKCESCNNDNLSPGTEYSEFIDDTTTQTFTDLKDNTVTNASTADDDYIPYMPEKQDSLDAAFERKDHEFNNEIDYENTSNTFNMAAFQNAIPNNAAENDFYKRDNDYENCSDTNHIYEEDSTNYMNTMDTLLGENNNGIRGLYEYSHIISKENVYGDSNCINEEAVGEYDYVNKLCGEMSQKICHSTKENSSQDKDTIFKTEFEQYGSKRHIERNIPQNESNIENGTGSMIDKPIDMLVTDKQNKSFKINQQLQNSNEGTNSVETDKHLKNNANEKSPAKPVSKCGGMAKGMDVPRKVGVCRNENKSQSEMFVVQMVQCPPDISTQTGSFLLDIAPHGLRLLDIKTKVQLMFWPFNGIRRFGKQKDKGQFLFEAGRRCEAGPGVYAFQSDDPVNIYEEILKISGGKNE